MTNKNALFALSGVPTGPKGAWDLSYAYYDPPADLAWNVSTAVYSGKSFSVAGQDTSPEAVFFKPDGTKMYIAGGNGDDVNEYNLSSAWDVSTASYLQNFSLVSEFGQPHGLFFKPDGTKMYVVTPTVDSVNEYDLSTAWDISTASYLQGFSVGGQEAFPEGLFFKHDGTKMYVVGSNGDDVNEYDLSTAWDVSTASYLQNFNVSTQDSIPTDIFFKPDGTKMYVMGDAGDDVNEYNLSTAWDISTASYSQSFSVAAQESVPNGLFFKPDGSAFYIVGGNVYQYTLGGFSVAAQELQPQSLSFKADGSKMYVLGAAGDEVNEYDLSTAWDVSTASYLQTFSVATQETDPQGLFFKPDGTAMYITGSSGDDVNQYSLSTAWDISSASYQQSFSVAAQSTFPQAIFFKTDGNKMYVIDSSTNTVSEYNLSTAWDVSTASYLQNFSFASQGSFPQGVFFKGDGSKMYVVISSNDSVNEYNLTTPWDVSSASYVQNTITTLQETSPQGVFFKSDGTQMFITGDNTDSVYSYTLGVQP